MIRAWLSLARRVLKLPEGNPPLPAGDPASVLVWNPGRGYLGYRLFWFWISIPLRILFLIALAAGVLVLNQRVVWPAVSFLLLAWLAVILVTWPLRLAWRYALVRLELDMLRYTVTDRAMRLRRGVQDLTEVTLSYANVQNVKYEQGPLQRAFGIADLVVEVAGGAGGQKEAEAAVAHGHEGRLIGVSEPLHLREVLLERVRAARGTGLGDAADHHPPPAGALDSPAARRVLAEIRDGLAAANAALRAGGRGTGSSMEEG